MSKIISALFEDSKKAGDAIAELKANNFDKDISVIAKDEGDQEVGAHKVGSDPMHGVKGGAISGAAVGGLGALAVGASAVTLPGLGLVVAGPIATFLTGLTGGALTGGVVGALVDQGISEDHAKTYESHINEGQVFASVRADDMNADEVASIFSDHSAKYIEVADK